MTMNTQEQALLDALRQYTDPYTGRDPVSTKSIRNLSCADGVASVTYVIGYPAQSQHALIQASIESNLLAVPGIRAANVTIQTQIVPHTTQRGLSPLAGVKNIIAVASGKGGVGKSTTTANLALALAAEGAKVGILDADIYGPSQPLVMGLQGKQPESPDGKHMVPLEHYGVATMSIGFMIDPEQPMVWRGPMVTQALLQLFNDTQWGELDYLVIDLPPGTGDVQLTLSQKIPVTGAVIVTTPQDIALLDARKGLKMFEKVGVPILGLVENMSMHVCSQCGHMEPIFGEGGADRMSQDYHVDLLGKLPLDLSIRLAADQGKPSVIADPQGKVAALYLEIARKVAARIANKSQDHSAKFPKIVIQNT